MLRRGGTRTGVLCSWRHKSLRIGSAWNKIGLRKTGGRPVSPIKQHGEGEAYHDVTSIFQHISACSLLFLISIVFAKFTGFLHFAPCFFRFSIVSRFPFIFVAFCSLFKSASCSHNVLVIFRYSMALLSQTFTFYSLIVFLHFHCFLSVFVVARK